MKKVTVKEAAEYVGLVKVGRFYYDALYVQGWVGYIDAPFGYEQVYLSDGVYADSTAYTGKEVLEMYEDCKEEDEKEAL